MRPPAPMPEDVVRTAHEAAYVARVASRLLAESPERDLDLVRQMLADLTEDLDHVRRELDAVAGRPVPGAVRRVPVEEVAMKVTKRV